MNNYDAWIKNRCRNCELPINVQNVYYKCSICQTYLICSQCEHYNFHIEHHQVKIKPKNWEVPLPFELNIKQKKPTQRINRYFPQKKCMLTPREAAVYDQLLRLTLTSTGMQDQKNYDRFNTLSKWFKYSCSAKYYLLVD